MPDDILPDHILQIGFGFWASKTLLSAVELAVFLTACRKDRNPVPNFKRSWDFTRAPPIDFLDTLVALGLLERDGAGESGRYANTPADGRFLVKTSPAVRRRHPGDGQCTAVSLLGRSYAGVANRPAAERDQTNRQVDVRSRFTPIPARLEQFMDAMSGISMGNFMAFAEKFDFSGYRHSGGHRRRDRPTLDRIVAARHPHMRCRTCDLAAVAADCRTTRPRSKIWTVE